MRCFINHLFNIVKAYKHQFVLFKRLWSLVRNTQWRT